MNIKELTREERRAFLAKLGQPAYREKQLFGWLCKGAETSDELSNIPAGLRAALKWENLTIALEQHSSDGTRKFLLNLPDGAAVEAVLMNYNYGNSLCISTQVGCAMGCTFCASTIGGRQRNLKAWEMLDEYVIIRKATGEAISNIVLMGIGEPLDNYDEVAEFLRLIHDPEGIGLSYRNITLSTCGLVPEMRRFGDEFPQVNLAVSLHAPKQKAREALMPVAKRYKLEELIAACKDHGEKTGRRVSFEYALIRGKNDRPEDADALVRVLKGLLCHVNLIALNPVRETGLEAAGGDSANLFVERLERAGLPVSIRRELGRDIDAACGQLRKNALV